MSRTITADNKTTVLIMAGGTGGHIFPALAVADVLQHRGANIEWLGTRKGLEARLVPEHHYPINFIEIGGLRGKGIKTLLLLPFRLARAMFQTLKVYNKVKPDVMLGMGGFVTGPGGIVGWLLGKPLVLHEQNAIAGMTNKILFKFSKKVLAAFPGAFNKNAKLSVIGNPVRKEIKNLAEPEQRLKDKWTQANGLENGRPLNILIVGGSLGATALNERMPEALEVIARNNQLLKSDFNRISVRHQCGEKHLANTKENYRSLEKYLSEKQGGEQANKDQDIKVTVLPFISDMAANYEWADLVVCRSGALTVSEIAAAGVASLLVPFPYAVDDHQTANAAYLANEGAAFLIQQNELDKEKLAEVLINLKQKNIIDMAVKARLLATSNAAEVVADECLQLAG